MAASHRSVASLIIFSGLFLCVFGVEFVPAEAHVARHHIPYFLSANHDTLHSIVRITWVSCRTKPDFSIHAYDDSGAFRGTLHIPWNQGRGCGQIVEFDSDDLEHGDTDKEITGIGRGEGDWQLFIEAGDPYFEVTSYVSTDDGFLMPMHDTVPFFVYRDNYHVTLFNFDSAAHENRLRIINPNDTAIFIRIYGQHDKMVGSNDDGPRIPMAAHQVITVTSEDLETDNPNWHVDPSEYSDVDGNIGPPEGIDYHLGADADHEGRWRLKIYSWGKDGDRWYRVPLIVMNIMEDEETGLLSNLSTRPDTSTTIVRGTEPVTSDPAYSFNFDFVFDDDVPLSVRDSFRRAAYRWESIVVGDLLPKNVSISRWGCGGSQGYTGEVDDILVFVSMGYLGGWAGPTGRAEVCRSAIRGGNDSLLPVAGWVLINEDARSNWNVVSESFDAIVVHELGHTLGFTSSILSASGYLRYYPSRYFAGPLARQAFIDQGGSSYIGSVVPMERDGLHWDDNVLAGEIMAPSVGGSSVISRITVQAFADLGYEVNLSAAETYYKNVF